jgi:hypothetical protein
VQGRGLLELAGQVVEQARGRNGRLQGQPCDQPVNDHMGEPFDLGIDGWDRLVGQLLGGTGEGATRYQLLSDARSWDAGPRVERQVKRRQTVEALPQPSSRAGSSCQGVEVRATNTTAAKQARSGILRPGPPLDRGGGGGSRGSTRRQNSSETRLSGPGDVEGPIRSSTAAVACPASPGSRYATPRRRPAAATTGACWPAGQSRPRR